MLQIIPTSFALLQRTAAAGHTLGQGTASTGSGGADLTWLMGVVAILLAAIAAMAFGFRKLIMGSMQNRAAKRDMRILDVLPLGGKRQLAVVRCYDRTFALGLGEKSVELVAEMDHEAIEADRAQREAGKGPTVASAMRRAVPERALAFQERLLAAKARLLGAHDVIPGPADRTRAESAPQPAAEPAGPLPKTTATPKANSTPDIQPFVPPPAPAPAPALGEVPARAGAQREFLA